MRTAAPISVIRTQLVSFNFYSDTHLLHCFDGLNQIDCYDAFSLF